MLHRDLVVLGMLIEACINSYNSIYCTYYSLFLFSSLILFGAHHETLVNQVFHGVLDRPKKDQTAINLACLITFTRLFLFSLS